KLKLLFAPDLIEHVFGYPYLSPKIPYFPGPGFGKWIFWMERLIRRECKEPACHMVSFMWGWGFPAAYLHKNLSAITHRRLYDLFGGTAMHYYRHLRKMILKKEAVSYDPKEHPADPPESYLEKVKRRKLPPTLFFSGDQNLIFPGSNKLTFEKIKEMQPDAPIEYQEFFEYGHQDVFMGKYCDRDVFPALIEFIKKAMN
ncbi:MAG: esterase, partial [Bdellovibrionales bacterium]|nr:esterase [Bdellovibrionales bacterium]